MQRLTQKLAATILLCCLFAAAHADDTAAVPNPLKLEVRPATIQFVKAYTAYAKAVRDRGVEGLKTFVTPDFALRGESAPLTGNAAFKELDACRIDLPGTRFSAVIHPLSVTGTDAVASTQETHAFHTKLHNQNMAGSVIEDWKETWRKTAQGWKLASMEPYRGNFGHVEGIAFTVLPEAKSEPAKTQEKQNVVK